MCRDIRKDTHTQSVIELMHVRALFMTSRQNHFYRQIAENRFNLLQETKIIKTIKILQHLMNYKTTFSWFFDYKTK